MSENNHDDFNDYMKFWIFKKEYEEGEVKVKVHNYITGKPIFKSYLSRTQKIHFKIDVLPKTI